MTIADTMLQRRHTERGVTLIETVVMLAVFVVAITAIASSVSYFYETNRVTLEQSLALDSAQRGIEAMVENIREATFSETGSFVIELIGPDEFIFYSDTDQDNAVERLHYYLDGTTFTRGVVEPSGTPVSYATSTETVSLVSDDVRNATQGIPIFAYFDESGAEIINYANVNDVVFVKVNLIVNVNPNRFPGEFTLRSSAAMRNLKTNP